VCSLTAAELIGSSGGVHHLPNVVYLSSVKMRKAPCSIAAPIVTYCHAENKTVSLVPGVVLSVPL